MFIYKDSFELEDENVITFEGSSIDSGLYSDALSPVINESTVLDLLHTENIPVVPLELEKNVLRSASIRKRDKLGSVFRTLSLRNKQKSLPSLIRDDSTLLDTQETITDPKEPSICSVKSVHLSEEDEMYNNPQCKEDSIRNVSNLYDITKPMLYASDVHLEDVDCSSDSEFPTHTHVTLSNQSNTMKKAVIDEKRKEQGVSTFRSLGRKFSFFRRKEKAQPENTEGRVSCLETEDTPKASKFDVNIHKELPESNEEAEIDPITLRSEYPQTENIVEQSHKKTTKQKNLLTKNEADAYYTVESLNLQNQLVPHHQTLPAKSCLKSSNFDLNQLNHFNGSYVLQKLQTGRCLKNLPEQWNVWLGNTSTINFQRKKYQILHKIDSWDLLLTLCNSPDFVKKNLKENYHQLFILKKGQLPIFHGNKSKKRLGEYVYVIPKGKEQLVWQSVTYLLLLGKFDLNSFGYNIAGICWRKLDVKNATGFHLTFYVDDRESYYEKNMLLFLSEIRVLIPENLKQYFKKCKTLLPGEKTISIFTID